MTLELVYWVAVEGRRGPAETTEIVADEAELADFFRRLSAGEIVGDVQAVHSGRPMAATAVPGIEVPDHQFVFGVRDGVRGAIWYWGEDDAPQCYSSGTGPSDRPWYNGTEFPSYCEIPMGQVHAAVAEFLRTARQPKCIAWQYDPAHATTPTWS
ncbi:hypothetical protein LZ318_22890 [Saccharopolyspora indica]|uniref:Imm1 family immunity protein n=1 Tax=Saccharopolyspora indica TaxID=1229659 RepID=UPI0022EAB8BF|nr:Imm1 family immunity protein [Saccharopolyspora indica]MDA3650019.1 Imm1 family immunity protein [Saccharopolyspora indica]